MDTQHQRAVQFTIIDLKPLAFTHTLRHHDNGHLLEPQLEHENLIL